MRLYELLEAIDKDQRKAGQVAGEEKARKIGPVLGKEPKQHPYKGRLVGENVEEVDEAQVATMRKYFAGDKNAQDELKITKMRQYFDDLRKKEEEELKRKKELQKSVQIGGNIKEVAPPDQEEWIKDRKADFKKRYGDRWKTVLYATAWKRHNKE